jgi:hypothetical protein
MLATVTNATMDAPCTMTVECTHARQVCEGGSCTCRRIHGVVGEHCHELTWISVWAISSVACNLCMHLVAALCCVRAKQTVVAPCTITCALLCALLMFAEVRDRGKPATTRSLLTLQNVYGRPGRS